VAASRLNSPRVSSSLIRPADHDCQVSCGLQFAGCYHPDRYQSTLFANSAEEI